MLLLVFLMSCRFLICPVAFQRHPERLPADPEFGAAGVGRRPPVVFGAAPDRGQNFWAAARGCDGRRPSDVDVRMSQIPLALWMV